MKPFRFRAKSREDTLRLAKHFGRLLTEGDVVLLMGGLGAGKTTFVQGVAAAWEAQIPATSPTFIVAQTLPGKKLIHHLDFYRLEKHELWEMGAQEYIQGGGMIPPGIALIEWADVCPELWPADAFEIRIETKGKERVFNAQGTGPHSKKILSRLKI